MGMSVQRSTFVIGPGPTSGAAAANPTGHQGIRLHAAVFSGNGGVFTIDNGEAGALTGNLIAGPGANGGSFVLPFSQDGYLVTGVGNDLRLTVANDTVRGFVVWSLV